MFDNAELTARGQQKCSSTRDITCSRIDALIMDLQRSDLRVMRNAGSGGAGPVGSSLAVSVSSVLRCPFEAQKLRRALRSCLSNQVPVSLALSGLNADNNTTQALQRFCDYLKSSLSSLNYRASDISLSLHSHQMSLRAFLLISNSVLGSGPRFVMLDALQMKPHSNRKVRDVNRKKLAIPVATTQRQ